MKRHLFHAAPRRRFSGSNGDLFCGHESLDGDICVEERDHPLHHYEADPEKMLLGRMLGRRAAADITEGNPTLRDYE